MLDDDMTIASGGISQYTNNKPATGTPDQLQQQTTQDYSEIDPYFYMYGYNKHRAVNPIDPDPDVISIINKDKDLKEQDDIGEILEPTLANISDGELRSLALKIIDSLKDNNDSFQISAVINSILNNFGLENTEEIKKEIAVRLKKALSKTNNSVVKDSLQEDNSQLVGKTYQVPTEILEIIKKELELCDRNRDKPYGYTFAMNIISNPSLTYHNMKRKYGLMKNLRRSSKQYRLYGGNMMKDWIEKCLNNDRSSVESNKKIKSTYTNGFKKSSNIPTIPTLAENTDFHPTTHIGHTSQPYIYRVDMSKLPLSTISRMTKDYIVPNLARFSMPTLMQFSKEIEQSQPKTSMDWATIFENFDICITKFEQGGKYICCMPELAKMGDFGDGFCLLCLKNVQPQFVETVASEENRKHELIETKLYQPFLDKIEEVLNKPALFTQKLDRIPTKEEILTIGDKRYTAEEALDKVEFVVGRKENSTPEKYHQTIEALKKIIEIYPNRDEWVRALDMTN